MNEPFEKEVRFDIYCKHCEHQNTKETADPCNDCLDHPSNSNTEKPIWFREKA